MPDATARARRRPTAIVPVVMPLPAAPKGSALARLQERDRILRLVKHQPGITRAQIMAVLDMDGRRYRQHIAVLVDTGRVHIRPAGRQTHIHPGRDRRRGTPPAGTPASTGATP